MQTSFAEIPDALRERVERWIAKRSKCPKGGRPRVADSWHNNFRALRVRWETKATHYMALVQMACALIAYRAATRRNGRHF